VLPGRSHDDGSRSQGRAVARGNHRQPRSPLKGQHQRVLSIRDLVDEDYYRGREILGQPFKYG
jgi:hypothetical protein